MPRNEQFHKETILDQIKEVFWLKGYNGTSMQDLVDATGLNRSSLYNSFGGKMELYQSVLKKYQGENAENLNQLSTCSKTGYEIIEFLFQSVKKEMLIDSNKKGCMFINCSTEMGNQNLQLNQLLYSNQAKLVSYFENWVEKGKNDGSINSNSDTNILANYLVNAFQGFRITGMNTSNNQTLNNIIETTLMVLK